jgi:phage gpG-like protein
MQHKINITSWTTAIAKVNKVYATLPRKVAILAVNVAKENFRKQGFTDKSFEPWKKRKVQRKGTKARQSGAILVDTGRLKRSIRVISINAKSARIGTDVPYAQIHNEGGKINANVSITAHKRKAHMRKREERNSKVIAHNVSSHTRKMNVKMPKRQFIGQSYRTNRRIEALMSREFLHALK